VEYISQGFPDATGLGKFYRVVLDPIEGSKIGGSITRNPTN